jgi:acetolactate synthase-1/2/3 large subunit
MQTCTPSDLMFDALLERGIDHVFCNLGTDHVSIIEEAARRAAAGLACPRFVLCPHENVAAHMAGGFFLATGRPQAVLVHVDAGTANAAMALHNLSRMRVPVLLMAGRAPYAMRGEQAGGRDNYVHFIQDPFDIGALVRPYVKWEFNLPHGLVTAEVIHRAHAVMASVPQGPVFLTLPREVLASEVEAARASRPNVCDHPVVDHGGVAPELAEALARRLLAAEHPIAITSYLGRKAEAVEALERLAMRVGLRVVEANAVHLNLPHGSPAHAGFDPAQELDRADFGLLLDVDVPYLPALRARAERIPWIQIDVDAIKRSLPLWSFPAEQRLEADCATVLRQVDAALERMIEPADRTRIAARLKRMAAERQARAEAVAAAAVEPGQVEGLSAASVCARIATRLAPRDVVVNEAIRNALVVQAQIPRQCPGTYVGVAGGGLGFSGGAALGLKLGNGARRVVNFVGDGVFHFCTPDSVYATAQREGLAILTVVFDNGGWQAVKDAVLRVHPHGAAASGQAFLARLNGVGERRFEKVGEAFGAHGEHIADPDALEGALQRCFAAIDGGQAAVLVVRLPPL